MKKFKSKLFLWVLPILSMLAACSKEAAEKADTSLSIGSSIMAFLKMLGLAAGWIVGIAVVIVIVVYALMEAS